jgi:RNA-directed DNA polymerase
LASSVTGYANFVKMVKPAAGASFQSQVNLLLQNQRLQFAKPETPSKNNPSQNNTNNKGDDKPWWNVT